MSRGLRRGLLGLIASVAMVLSVAANVPMAGAAGRITLSASEGNIGDVVNVTGSGFVSQMSVKAYFSSDAASPGNAIDTNVTHYQVVAQGPTDSNASITLQMPVPAKLQDGPAQAIVGPGDYYVYITYSDSKQIQAVARFFVLGPVSVNPTSGKIGDSVSILGTGLKGNEMAYVYFSSNRALPGASIGSQVTVYEKSDLIVTSKEGVLSTSFQIPSRLADGKAQEDVHAGDYYFYVTYTTATIQSITHFVLPQPPMTVSPQSGNAGVDVKISGEGLRPNQNLTATYDGQIILIKSGDTVTTADGKFNSTIVIPESVVGSHQIVVADVTGNRPSTWYTVNPVVTLPDSAQLGDTVQVSGSGFGEAADMTITTGGVSLATNPPIMTTNRKGSFSGSFVLPQPPGNVTIVVADKYGTKVEKKLNALPVSSTGVASITLNPATSAGSPGYVGQKITVSGAKFSQSSTVTVSYGTTQTQMATAKTDASGAFEAQFTVPAGKAGPWTVTATDGKNQATAVFTMEAAAPQPPQPIVPEAVSGNKPTTRFAWNGVTDPSGVTYTLQVASSSAFAPVIIEKTGLTPTEYTLGDGERLQLKNTDLGYYWRVRAVDGAGNASIWSTPLLFYVGSSQSPMPQWIVYVMIGWGVVVLVVLGVWLRRYIADRRI